MIGVRRRQAELAEDVPDVLLGGPLLDHENPGDGAVGPAFGHQSQHVVLPGRVGAEPVGATTGTEQFPHDLWIESSAAGRHPAQRFDEFTDIGDPVLEVYPMPAAPLPDVATAATARAVVILTMRSATAGLYGAGRLRMWALAS